MSVITHSTTPSRPAMPGSDRRPGAHRIATDREALDIARSLAPALAAEASARDRNRTHPHAEIDRFSASGLWGITVPRAYGGAEVSAVTLAEVTAIISQADSSIGQIPQNHWYMVEALRLDGFEAQKTFFFDLVLSGTRFGNAYSERGTVRATEHATRLRQTANGPILNGTKYYSSGVLHADWIAAVARDDENRVVIAFVRAGTEGVEVIDDWSSFGQRTTASGTTNFQDVRVDPAHIVPHHAAFDRPTSMGPLAQIIHAAVDVGIARAALADTLIHARQARPWVDSGHDKATDDPYTLAIVGRLQTDVDAASAMLARAGRFVDAASLEPDEQAVAEASVAVAEAKILANDAALATSNILFELAGTRSTVAAANLDRHWRNARTHTLHDPVRWKYHAIGNYHLNAVKPPRYGAL